MATNKRLRFQVFLDPPQLAALRTIETETGAPIAAQIRRAVDAWLLARGAATTPASTSRRGAPKKGK